MQFLSKPQQDFFIDVDKVILKCTWIGRKEKKKRIAKTILKTKNKVREISPPSFKTYFVSVTFTVWYILRDRHREESNRVENIEITLHMNDLWFWAMV